MSQQITIRGKLAFLVWNLPSSMLVVESGTGKFYQVFRVDKPEFRVRGKGEPKVSMWSCYRKEKLCGKTRGRSGHGFRRVHATCWKCRLRRVVNGTLPPMLEVSAQIILYATDRTPINRRLGKLFCTLTETFST